MPATAAIGLIVATVAGPFAAAATFLLLFNAVHIALRVWGLLAGWRTGVRGAAALRHPVLQAGLRASGPLAAVAIGFAIPVVAVWLVTDFGAAARWGIAGVAVATAIATRWLTPTFGAARLGLLALVATLVLGWLW